MSPPNYNLNDYRRRQATRDEGPDESDLVDARPGGCVSCYKCGKGIPEDETTCYHCGIHFDGGTAYDYAPETAQRGLRKRRRNTFMTWALIMAFLLAACGYGAYAVFFS